MSEAKSHFSSYLNEVQRGETVLIFDRDRLIARLEPVDNADIPDADPVKALVRSGVASAPRHQLDISAFLPGRGRDSPEGATEPEHSSGSATPGEVAPQRTIAQ